MHPNTAFDWTDREAMLSFVAQHAFAHVFSAGEAGLAVVHVPVLVTPTGKVQFHVSRRNRAAQQVARGQLLISIVGREAYQSANWYASPDQVPTWHYESVEIEGPARQLQDDELVQLLDSLSSVFEQRYSAEGPWTRAKMSNGKFEAMSRAIIGFEVDPVAFRGTRKFNQHKDDADTQATITGQEGAGRPDIAQAIMEVRGTAK